MTEESFEEQVKGIIREEFKGIKETLGEEPYSFEVKFKDVYFINDEHYGVVLEFEGLDKFEISLRLLAGYKDMREVTWILSTMHPVLCAERAVGEGMPTLCEQSCTGRVITNFPIGESLILHRVKFYEICNSRYERSGKKNVRARIVLAVMKGVMGDHDECIIMLEEITDEVLDQSTKDEFGKKKLSKVRDYFLAEARKKVGGGPAPADHEAEPTPAKKKMGVLTPVHAAPNDPIYISTPQVQIINGQEKKAHKISLFNIQEHVSVLIDFRDNGGLIINVESTEVDVVVGKVGEEEKEKVSPGFPHIIDSKTPLNDFPIRIGTYEFKLSEVDEDRTKIEETSERLKEGITLALDPSNIPDVGSVFYNGNKLFKITKGVGNNIFFNGYGVFEGVKFAPGGRTLEGYDAVLYNSLYLEVLSSNRGVVDVKRGQEKYKRWDKGDYLQDGDYVRYTPAHKEFSFEFRFDISKSYACDASELGREMYVPYVPYKEGIAIKDVWINDRKVDRERDDFSKALMGKQRFDERKNVACYFLSGQPLFVQVGAVKNREGVENLWLEAGFKEGEKKVEKMEEGYGRVYWAGVDYDAGLEEEGRVNKFEDVEWGEKHLSSFGRVIRLCVFDRGRGAKRCEYALVKMIAMDKIGALIPQDVKSNLEPELNNTLYLDPSRCFRFNNPIVIGSNAEEDIRLVDSSVQGVQARVFFHHEELEPEYKSIDRYFIRPNDGVKVMVNNQELGRKGVYLKDNATIHIGNFNFTFKMVDYDETAREGLSRINERFREKALQKTGGGVQLRLEGHKRIAIISDIHGNIQALNAVLRNIDDEGIDEIYCLGDLVGYCANPDEVVERIRGKEIKCITGNHDAVISKRDGWKKIKMEGHARVAANWTDEHMKEDNLDFLRKLDPRIDERDIRSIFVHGNLEDPIEGYIGGRRLLAKGFQPPEESLNKLNELQDFDYCFVGHSHEPCIWHLAESDFVPSGGRVPKLEPIEPNTPINVEKKSIINVGSVGQPRDGVNWACYVIAEFVGGELKVEFRRVRYSISKAQAAIMDAYKEWRGGLNRLKPKYRGYWWKEIKGAFEYNAKRLGKEGRQPSSEDRDVRGRAMRNADKRRLRLHAEGNEHVSLLSDDHLKAFLEAVKIISEFGREDVETFLEGVRDESDPNHQHRSWILRRVKEVGELEEGRPLKRFLRRAKKVAGLGEEEIKDIFMAFSVGPLANFTR